jgi:hypothetical protein
VKSKQQLDGGKASESRGGAERRWSKNNRCFFSCFRCFAFPLCPTPTPEQHHSAYVLGLVVVFGDGAGVGASPVVVIHLFGDRVDVDVLFVVRRRGGHGRVDGLKVLVVGLLSRSRSGRRRGAAAGGHGW